MNLAGRDQPNRERELLALLFTLNQQLSRGASLEDLLGEIAQATCRLSRAESASVMLFDDVRGELLCKASAGLPREEAEGITFRLGEGVAGWVAQSGQPLTIVDTATDPRFKPVAHQRTTLRSLCCVPMFARSGVIGVVSAGSSRPHEFDAKDEELLCYLAAAIAKDVENARLYRLAVTDPLTGAFNRQFLSDRLPSEVDRHRRYGQTLSVILIDIDHFKQVNDTWGHQAGDSVLAEMSTELMALTRDVDYLVRYGGEEFLLVLPSTRLEGARLLAERLRLRVAHTPFIVPGHNAEVQLTISAGVAELSPTDVDGAALISRADAVLYEAKSTGRDRVLCAHTVF